MMSRVTFPVLAGIVVGLPLTAQAHWCDSLWGSAYNVVVKPEGEAVTSDDGWSLGVAIQNNMGYPLYRFDVVAESSNSSFAIGISRDPAYPAAKNNYLMPGEKIRYIVEATRHDATQLDVADIQFFISFGNQTQTSDQSRGYGNRAGSSPSEDVVIRTPGGSVYPFDLGSDLGRLPYNQQGKTPSFVAQADNGTTAAEREEGVKRLLQFYCAGGHSWEHTGQDDSQCQGDATVCASSSFSTIVDSDSAKYQFQHLWSSAELGARKSLLEDATCGSKTCLEVFRDRLMCAEQEQTFLYKGMAYLVLGYLGPDSGAQSFLEGEAGTGSPSSPVEYAARAALYLQGDASYEADVIAGVSYSGSQSGFVNALCSAALGIKGPNADTAVQALIDEAGWQQPNTTSDGTASLPFYNSYLLDLVSWHRRTWAAQGGDTGYPTYYFNDVVDETPPAAPAGFSCEETGSSTAPELRLSWNQVTQDTAGEAENVASYRIDWGTSARTCTSPADFDGGGDCGYQHTDTTASGAVITYVPDNLSYTDTTYYFSVHAIDAAGNRSAFAQPGEVSCVARTPQHPPTAQVSCDQTTITVPPDTLPATVACNCSASTDEDGDIATCTFRIDGGDPETVDFGSGQFSATFNTAGESHTITLVVTDSSGLASATPAEVTIEVQDGTNALPDAEAVATVTSGDAPLTVSFSDSSTDSDGTIASWHWVFGNGDESTDQDPGDVTFNTAGTYAVSLTVTDSSGGTATDVVLIVVTEASNAPPDLRFAAVNPLIVPPGENVTFNAGQVADPDGDNFTVNWDFGDGNSSTESLATHSYSSKGQYDAVLSAQDDGTPALAPATRTFPVIVTNNSQPDCAVATVAPLSGKPPLTVTLDASGCQDADSGDQLQFEWNISALRISPIDISEAPAVTTYTLDSEAAYDITLIATDSGDPPLQSQPRKFSVNVSSDAGGLPPFVVSCASTRPFDLGLAALLVFGLGLFRRRKS